MKKFVMYQELGGRGNPDQRMQILEANNWKAIFIEIAEDLCCFDGEEDELENHEQVLKDMAEEFTIMIIEMETGKTWSNWD